MGNPSSNGRGRRVARVAQVDLALPGEGDAVAGHAGGQHAVEQVSSPGHRLRQPFGIADAQRGGGAGPPAISGLPSRHSSMTSRGSPTDRPPMP